MLLLLRERRQLNQIVAGVCQEIKYSCYNMTAAHLRANTCYILHKRHALEPHAAWRRQRNTISQSSSCYH